MKSIQFDSRLYARKAVEKAAAEYAQVADLRIVEKSGWIVVEVAKTQKGLDPAEFEGEFANYVLGNMG